MDWNAVALALEAVAETTGINALDYVPDELPNTAFYVGEMDITPNVTFGNRAAHPSTRTGTDEATITCRVLVARSTDKYGVRKMREYCNGGGLKSLVQAIQANKTLNGTVHGNKVAAIRGNRMFTVGERRFYGAEIEVYVIGAAT